METRSESSLVLSLVAVLLFAIGCQRVARPTGDEDEADPSFEELRKSGGDAELACVVDDDCTLFSASCCTACGGSAGVALNRSAQARRRALLSAECAKIECPDIACEGPPPCREERHAYCDEGRCAMRTVEVGECDSSETPGSAPGESPAVLP